MFPILTYAPNHRPLFSRSRPHERRNMRSVWPVGMAWGRWGRQTSSSLNLNGRSDRVNEVTYDYLGNATTIKQTGNITDEIFAEFDYNANGLLTAINRYEEDENDVLTAVANSLYEYNANNAVTSITHKKPDETQIVKHSYTYDSTNNIVEYLNSIDGNTEYNYDFLGQLISADYASQTDESYAYDSNGNRIVANGDAYTTGTNNELTSDGDYTYTYDAEGNRTSKTNSTNRELYTWDYRNRLTQVTQQTFKAESQTWETIQIVEYSYDYNNIWIRKVIGNNKIIFIPENYQTTVQIDNGATTHHYLWTPNQQDKLLADTTIDGVSWSLTDHLGTIRDIIGSENAHLIYDAFGNLISGTNPLLFGYTGKPFDPAANLQNNINRWYDAAVGRWLSTDPIGFEGNDTNLYRYVSNSPKSFVDIEGLQLSGMQALAAPSDVLSHYVPPTYERIGGLDITHSLLNIQSRLRKAMNEVGIDRVCDICNSLFNKVTALFAWDIEELRDAGSDGKKYSDVFSTDKFGVGALRGSVTVNGNCYWAAEVNYYLLGVAAKICAEKLTDNSTDAYLWLESALLYTHAYRSIGYLNRTIWDSSAPARRSPGNGVSGRLAWILAGWENDFSLAVSSRIQNCVPCDKPYPAALNCHIGASPGRLLGFYENDIMLTPN